MKSSPSKSKILLNYKKIILGVINAYLMTLTLFLLLGALLYFTKLTETFIPSAVMVISAISVLFCGIRATRDVDTLGWLHGGLIGLIYVALLLVVGVTIGNSGLQGWAFVLDLALGFVAGSLSGVLGVNL